MPFISLVVDFLERFLLAIRKEAFNFSGWVYRQRNLAERLFNRIRDFPTSPAAPDSFLSARKLAAIRIWPAR